MNDSISSGTGGIRVMIDRYFANTSRPKRETLEGLETIREKIDMLIDVLEADIEMEDNDG